MTRHKLILTAILTAVLVSADRSYGQTDQPQPLQTSPGSGDQYYPPIPSDQQIQMMRKDVRSRKKQIIAVNMDLTDAQAEKFWPIYDQYTADLAKVYDTRFALIKEYLETYSTATDQQAESYAKRWAATDESILQLRLKYFPVFRRVLSGKSTALFFQMDRRLGLMIDLQLTGDVPILEP